MANLNLRTRSRAGSTDTRLEIDATRGRQTERPPAPFRSVLAGGVSVLMTGAEVATHVVGGPVLAAAVHDARIGATGAVAGTAAAARRRRIKGRRLAAAAAGATGNPGARRHGVADAAGPGVQSAIARLAAAGAAGDSRFTTVSNVMRAKHDTAKAAVSNIRA